MSASSLFPDEAIKVEPAPDRSAPLLWIRRLVIVPERKVGVVPIQDVPFRLGLNIVRTELPKEGETSPVGHSVGKTLLTRLIRYGLGEATFATKNVRIGIERVLPEAFLLAEFVVDGTNWVVARPMRAASLRESFALESGDYREALVADAPGKKPFSDFTDFISRATVDTWVNLGLPDAGHPARWLDLLGWLSRDHDCRYRVFNEWREPDAESGTAQLKRDDAKFFLRLAMDLMDSQEKGLIEKHATILNERNDTQRTIQEQERQLAYNRAELAKRIELPPDAPATGLFANQIIAAAKEKRDSLQRLLDDMRAQSNVGTLEADHDRLIEELADATSAIRQNEAFLEAIKPQFARSPKLTHEQYLKMVGPRANCTLADCPFKEENLEPAVDPNEEERLADLQRYKLNLEQEITQLQKRIPALQQQKLAAADRLVTGRREYETQTKGTIQALGRQDLIIELVDEYEKARRTHATAVRRAEKLEKVYKESLERQSRAREIQAAKQRRLSVLYDWILKNLVGPQAEGTIELDAVGLRPEPLAGVAANGAALATLARVLGLDLACLTASITGLGHHPRFLIHDSPKEADMESTLYDRIFALALRLEQTFGDHGPSFQYIITTTSPPPMPLSGKPHSRLLLHARDETGLLLKTRF